MNDEAVAAGRPIVLVVDDSAVYQMLLSRQLADLGYDAVIAGDIAAVISALGSTPPDLVLLDRHFADNSDEPIVDLVREATGAPVVCMSTSADPGVRQPCAQAGVVAFIGKPLPTEELRDLVVGILAANGTPADGPTVTTGVDDAVLRLLAEQMGDLDVALSVVDIFIEGAPGRLVALTGAVETKDVEVIRRVAHSLKSSARLVGLCSLSDVAAIVEHDTTNEVMVAGLVAALGESAAELRSARSRLIEAAGANAGQPTKR